MKPKDVVALPTHLMLLLLLLSDVGDDDDDDVDTAGCVHEDEVRSASFESSDDAEV